MRRPPQPRRWDPGALAWRSDGTTDQPGGGMTLHCACASQATAAEPRALPARVAPSSGRALPRGSPRSRESRWHRGRRPHRRPHARHSGESPGDIAGAAVNDSGCPPAGTAPRRTGFSGSVDGGAHCSPASRPKRPRTRTSPTRTCRRWRWAARAGARAPMLTAALPPDRVFACDGLAPTSGWWTPGR